MTTADAPALSYSSAPGRWVLLITVAGSGIASLDATVVNIALPTIGRDFHTGIAALQWVMNGYTLTLAAFLLLGGALGRRFGPRQGCLGGVRVCSRRGVPHCYPRAPRSGGGAAHAGKPGDLGSVVPAGRPGPGDRGVVGPERRGRRRRAAGRWLPDHGRVVAVDLLHQ